MRAVAIAVELGYLSKLVDVPRLQSHTASGQKPHSASFVATRNKNTRHCLFWTASNYEETVIGEHEANHNAAWYATSKLTFNQCQLESNEGANYNLRSTNIVILTGPSIAMIVQSHNKNVSASLWRSRSRHRDQARIGRSFVYSRTYIERAHIGGESILPRSTVVRLQATAKLCRRLAELVLLCTIAQEFGRSFGSVSRIIQTVVDCLYEEHSGQN